MDQQPELTPASYDDFPYPSHAYTQTHPDHLATLAVLSGLSPAAVEECRVLELGCSSGGNLIPMAYSLPGSTFVGVDFSGAAVAKGQQTIERLGLNNIVLHNMDFLDVTPSFGQFDYIIAYGIYSWVPAEVQEKILQICRDNLAPEGVVYVSYNVYPGWHMFQAVREAMFYGTRRIEGWPERVQKARWFLDFMADNHTAGAGYIGSFLSAVQLLISQGNDGYLRHDFLAENNTPVYFHQFVERASEKGLQFLANGSLSSLGDVPEEVLETIMEMAEDHIEIEQFLDFMGNRTFRETLLCHESCPVKRDLDPASLADLRIASRVKPEEEEFNPGSTETTIFLGPAEKNLSTAHPLTKAALLYLASQYPRSVRFTDLVIKAQEILLEVSGGERLWSEEDSEILASNFLRLYGENVDLVNLHTFQPGFLTEIPEQPVASATARIQVKEGTPVTNLYHQRITIDEGPARLLAHLDGNHDHQALIGVIADLVEEGAIEVSLEGVPVEDAEILQATISAALDMQLKQVAEVGLLVNE
jgi:methyltransferase-like protein/SAM-dependent methyltransferase